MRAGWLLALAGCQTVFPLEDPTPAACKHDGLQLCLAFEDALEDGSATDGSPRKLDAVIDKVTVVERLPGEQAIEVADDSNVVVNHVNDFDFTTALSVDLWVKFDATSSVDRIIFDNDQQYTVSVPANTNKIGCSIHIVPAITGDQDFFGIEGPGQLGDWHHIACVFENPMFRAYLDGALIATQTTTGPLFTAGTLPPRIGRAGGDANPRPFAGQIDNVRIWDRGLTQDEVAKFADNEETEIVVRANR